MNTRISNPQQRFLIDLLRFSFRERLLPMLVLTAFAVSFLPLPVHAILQGLNAHDWSSIRQHVTLGLLSPDRIATERPVNGITNAANFWVHRVFGPTNQPVFYTFSVSGTASNSVDYRMAELSGVLAPNVAYTNIFVRPIPDLVQERNETVVISLVDPHCWATNSPTNPTNVGCYMVSTNNRVEIVIQETVPEPTNRPPVVTIAMPADGAVFDPGEPIRIRAEASDPDFNLDLVYLHLDNQYAGETNGPVLAFWTNALPGEHTLIAYTIDRLGARGTSAPVQILVRGTNSPAFVERELPNGYSPGNPFIVRLVSRPAIGNHVWAVEDEPPRGWAVSAVSDEGVFDPATGKVKFGYYTDTHPRFLTYQITPPFGITGRYEFNGAASMDGLDTRVGGDRIISDAALEHHPADRNVDNHITLAELTGFGAPWRQGSTWSNAPSPIPANYVSQAALIWRRGETYHFVATNPAPQSWVPNATQPGRLAAVSASTARRDIAPRDERVTIDVQPGAGTSAYNVEERLPVGWSVG